MNTFFIKPRVKYDPYFDFYSIAELSGYEVKWIDQVDWNSSDTGIISPMNGESEGIPDRHNLHLIHWNLERVKPGEAPHPKVDETWFSDRAEANAANGRYVFLGGIRSFADLDIGEKQWDIVTLLAWFGRRPQLRHDLQEAGVSIADPDGNNWGQHRVETLQHSRIMLSCHQDEYPWCEPIRFCIGAMYALPLVSETCADAGLWNGLYLQAPMSGLVDVTKCLLADPIRQARMGAAAWRLCCVEHPFRQEVERALERVAV